MNPWWALARADRVNVLRDPMLVVSSGVALPLGTVVRLGRDPLTELLAPWVDVDTSTAVLLTFVLILPALLAGTVQAFLWLEERDDHVEAAVRMTPVGLDGLWRWRIGAGLVMGGVSSGLGWLASGLPAPSLLPLGFVVAGLHSPAITGILVSFARDKVQGLALSKVTSLAAVAPLTLALPGAAAGLGALFPSWWLALGLRSDDEPAMVGALGLVGAALAGLTALRRRGARDDGSSFGAPRAGRRCRS